MSEQSFDQQTTPIDVARTCAALYSRVFSRLVTRHYNHHLSDTDLRITQFSILNAIKLSPQTPSTSWLSFLAWNGHHCSERLKN